jgi:S1-C subfamily serine protease
MGEVSAAGLGGEVGVLVLEVPQDSIAAKIGLRAGDVVLKAGALAVANSTDLRRKAGDETKPVALTVWRDQKAISLSPGNTK